MFLEKVGVDHLSKGKKSEIGFREGQVVSSETEESDEISGRKTGRS